MGDIYDILCRYKRWDDPIDAVFTVFMINFCLSHVLWNLELRTWNWDRSPSDNPYNLQHIHSTMAICCVSRDQQTVFKISLVLRGEYSELPLLPKILIRRFILRVNSGQNTSTPTIASITEL